MANRFNVRLTVGSGRLKYLMIISAVTLALLCDPATARSYAAAPFGGRVVDAETGQPIPGVIVLAQWLVEGPAESHPVAAMQIMETVTDLSGRYAFPGWGPKAVPRPDFWSWIIAPVLSTHDPELFFFKAGYGYVSFTNLPDRGAPIDPEVTLRRSQLDGKDVRLSQIDGDLATRRSELNRMLGLPLRFVRDNCGWLEMPLTIQYLFAEHKNLTPAGEKSDLSEIVHVHGCGRPIWIKEPR